MNQVLTIIGVFICFQNFFKIKMLIIVKIEKIE